MKKLIKILSALSAISIVSLTLSVTSIALKTDSLSGETDRTVTEIYNGVTNTHFSLSKSSKYGQQEINIVEFDPSQSDLYFDVLPGGSYTNSLKSVSNQVTAFNKRADRKVICAINGDLWMTVAHSRNGGYSYKDYSDQVTTKTYTTPRGFNMYDGEIWTSAQISQETPMEGEFYAFGITEDGIPALGKPVVKLAIKNTTSGKSVYADGLNRLPANNALIVYSDKASSVNYALSDSYEVTVDCDPYTICHGATIKGKVTSITPSGSETRASFKENRLVFTARGNKINLISEYKTGDEIELSVSVTDALGNDTLWQNMKNAVGGHIPVIINGKSQNVSNSTAYPMSVLGITEAGKVIILANDGRQSGYSDGLMISMLDDLCADLGIVTAFILDGGGSTALSELQSDGSYKIINRPSDGSERQVVNTVVLSAGPDKSAGNQYSGLEDLVFDSDETLKLISDEVRCKSLIQNGALRIENTDEKNQHLYMKLSGLSADEYKYMIIKYKPDWTRTERYSISFRFCVGGIYTPSDSMCRAIYYDEAEPDSDGYVTQIVDLSKASKWTGTIRGMQINVNDYISRGTIGEGTLINSVSFRKTPEEATALTVITAEETTTAETSVEETSAQISQKGCSGTVQITTAVSLTALFVPFLINKKKIRKM